MNEVQVFSFESSHIRTMEDDLGNTLFVGKDVCDVLGYRNPTDAMNQHCKGVAKRYPLQTEGGMQDVRVLTEADVLRLVISSNLPAAVKFEAWVFEEVLPTIRKTGSYSHSDAALLQKLVHAQDKIIELQGDLLKKKSEQKTYAAQRHSSKKSQKEKILSMLKKDKETPMHAITKALHSTIEGLKDCMEELQQSGLIECKTEKPPRGRTRHLVRMV